MAKTLRFRFSRDEGLKYIAHLDILRVFERALRRSGLPVAYTQGFNPREKIVFGLPISMGLTSEAEYADIELERDITPETFMEALNKSLPLGIRVLEASEQNIHDNIMNQITAARYEITLETKQEKSLSEMEDLVSGMLSKEDIQIMKKTKKGMKPFNIRSWIYSLTVIQQEPGRFVLEAFLSAGTENNLRADLLTEAFLTETGLEAKVLSMHRKALFASSFNEWKSPFEVANG